MLNSKKNIHQKKRSLQEFLNAPLFLLLFFFGSCASTTSFNVAVQGSAAIPVDSLVAADPEMLAFIDPFKENMAKEMDGIIGYAARELVKEPVESSLGNFVADLLAEKGEEYAGIVVDMGGITTGGLRAPVPQGPIRLRDIYELMPFENTVKVLELTGEQTLQLFQYAASTQNIALSGTKLLVENGRPAKIEIRGKPFDPAKKYTLAISDYLANGGDKMTFLKEAKRLAVPEIKLRDIIIEKVTELQAQDREIDAQIEGRVVVKE